MELKVNEVVRKRRSIKKQNPRVQPKNRSGRVVKQSEERVYVAQTLLNTYNARPLMPFKASAIVSESTNGEGDAFKIHKFVKFANRTQQRRIDKFKKSVSSNSIVVAAGQR